MNTVMLMMAGVGSRFGAAIPKQFTIINKKPIFLPIIENYQKLKYIDNFIIVTHKDWVEQVKEWTKNITKEIRVVSGGATRSESVSKGLIALSDKAQPDDIILIHDATHPYIDAEGTEKVIQETKFNGAATLASFGYDTVYQINRNNGCVKKVLSRVEVINGASPEAFKYGLISAIFSKASREELDLLTSAGAIAIASGVNMVHVKTEILNLKITYARDMELYKILGEKYFFRSVLKEKDI